MNARSCFEEDQEATPHETMAARPLTSHIKNDPR